MRIERLAPGEEPLRGQWQEALRAGWQSGASAIKQEGETSVWRARLLGRDVIVKQRAGPATMKELCGLDRESRQWRGAQWLQAHGIPTARCLVLATTPPRPRCRWLVLEAIDGTTLLQLLAQNKLAPRQQHTLARALARQLAALTLAGRYNRDHKPSNLIVQNPGSPEPTIAIIDTVAIRKLRPWRRADLYAMFVSLVLEPMGCGCPPRRSLMMRVLVEHQRELLRRIPNLLPQDDAVRRAARHQDWMRIAGLIDAHGDPTPKVNPLA